MNIYVAATLFAVLVFLYWAISEAFTVMFRLIGLPAEKARFQVVSLLTGTGFTTRESEMILSSRPRRRLARATMLFGYLFNITIVSALVNIFVSLEISELRSKAVSLIIPVAAIIAVILLSRGKHGKVFIDRTIERLAGRIDRDASNSVMLIDEIGKMTIARITLTKVPDELCGKTLAETGLKSEKNILVLAVERQGVLRHSPEADTTFFDGDRITVYGEYSSICEAFNAKERFRD